MSEFRTRRRMSHPFRILACLIALVMVLGVVFAGIGSAEESGGERPGGLGSAGPLGERAPAVGDTEQYYARPEDRGPADRRAEPPPDSDGARARDDARAERDGARADRATRSARDETRDDSRRDDNRRDDNRRDEPDDTDEPPNNDSPNNLYVPDELADELVAGTPCTKQAVACVSIGAKKSWLFTKGGNGDTAIDRTVSVSTGGPGKETPLGDFVVEWKHKDHKSSEFFKPHGCTPGTPGCEGAPMNWAVFFAQGGIAFHQGTLNQRSSGCVRLSAADAEYYYTFLQIGDKVEVRA